ncbi:hypothetical protein FOA43_002653 [Brettanomyces nanus]|uniref:Uncharacterized protein n=1 Tax=Eeniella nana TaxID=13502 RepID=A0A875S5J4_EENNA|nr:uncharacterized protein FOA43_002653 [Brettanomyces nanus]QPG75302.1 hypothetical protein FOA43_002653 [Brettanomyces nanus]
MKKALLIGVDVGGTNTDCVLIDPSEFGNENKGVLSWNKVVTTADVSKGIERGILKLLDDCSQIEKHDIISVTIGTTHFINAVIEQDQARLDRVAVLRLCGPYSHNAPPFSDFPRRLKRILNGYIGFLNGGYQVDGNEIQQLDEAEIINHAEEIKRLHLRAVAIVGIFSPMKADQELKVKQILQREIPGIRIAISNEVSGIGYLERENATILNAATMNFANKIITSFMTAMATLGLSCPLFLTQNDGTVLPAEECRRLPIKTFSSGTTNSMRGASFLGDVHGKSVVVVDVGGTTCDVGLLLPTGFPRQSSSYSIVGGVRMNFSMPHVESIGLGGGSYVRTDTKSGLTVGPDSSGCDIVNQALVFGGGRITATDVAVAVTKDDQGIDLEIGDAAKTVGVFTEEFKADFKDTIKNMLEKVIDRMKTSPDDISVLAVGGGSFMVPETLEGATQVIKPLYYSVANAIGAAMGKISSEVHVIKILLPGGITKEHIIEELKAEAVEKAVAKGAVKESVSIVYISAEPIPYVSNTFEFFIKTIADVDYSRIQLESEPKVGSTVSEINLLETSLESEEVTKNASTAKESIEAPGVNYVTYQPFINEKRQWLLSETDLEYICIGCYIVGSGGGGNPYSFFLEARNLLRGGDTITVVDVKDASKYVHGDGCIASICYAGSPTVSHEQLSGDALKVCYDYMAKYLQKNPELLFPIEIGGGNGLSPFEISSSSRLNIPVVDCDLMGRAYPTHWQTIPVVYAKPNESCYPPTVISNGNSNTMIIADSKTDALLERCMRAALSEIGATVGVMNPPMTQRELELKTIHNSLSLCWRIGKAVKIARQKSEIDSLPLTILSSINDSGKHLFSGKIVGVERTLRKGHIYGEVTIEELEEPRRKMVIPFKNENIYCKLQNNDGSDSKVVCSVPDLIAVIDADTGEAVGTPDYRYGLLVFVLGIAPSNKWTDSERGLAIGGPEGFDLDLEYHPISNYSPPLSVIDEYGQE